jgi:hypothetical protein
MVSTVLLAAVAGAATIDMNDPRRAVGLENDVRVDAQLASDSVSAHSRVVVTYQIQNFSPEAIAVAEACDVTYDSDSRTVTVAIGQEIPEKGQMPALVLIGPGERRVFTTGGILRTTTPDPRKVPRLVQIQVNILRDLAPLLPLLRQPERRVVLTDEQFDRWLESNETIFLNAIPVRFRQAETSRTGDASR